MSLFSRLVIAATHNPVARTLATRTRPGRALAERFVAGEDLDQAMTVASTLAQAGLSVSLDLLGEEVTDLDMAVEARQAYQECLKALEASELAANISIKLTQLGLAIDPRATASALDELASAASSAGTTVTIDMEDSRYTEATVEMYATAQAVHGNLGICLQAYLRRTPEDLERLAPLGGHIRLCKGAYVEPPELAFQSNDDVDTAFARLLIPLMKSPNVTPAIATHDHRLIELTADLARHRQQPFEFQMLYGVRSQLQRDLVDRGYPLRVYVPYGSEWYAYLTRRLAERPANLIFFLRAVGRS